MTMMRAGFNSMVSPVGTAKLKSHKASPLARAAAVRSRKRFAEGGGTLDVDTQGAAAEAAAAGHSAAIDAAGGRAGALDQAMDFINSKFDAKNLGGTLLGGMMTGPASMIGGALANALGSANEAQIQAAIEKGNFNERGELIGTGLMGEQTAINNGPGPTGGGFRDNGDQSNDRGGGMDGENAAQGAAPTSSTPGAAASTQIWDPQTRSYVQVTRQPDGSYVRADGTPAWRDGGEVSGLLDGGTGGRSDKVLADLPEGAYIIPATEVSARGEGNTGAGIRGIAEDLGFDPNTLETVRGGPVKARVAHGEAYIAPRDVERAGGPGALDRYVMHLRQQHINMLKNLPRPR